MLYQSPNTAVGWEISSIADLSSEEADHRTVRNEISSAIDVALLVVLVALRRMLCRYEMAYMPCYRGVV